MIDAFIPIPPEVLVELAKAYTKELIQAIALVALTCGGSLAFIGLLAAGVGTISVIAREKTNKA